MATGLSSNKAVEDYCYANRGEKVRAGRLRSLCVTEEDYRQALAIARGWGCKVVQAQHCVREMDLSFLRMAQEAVREMTDPNR